MSAYSYRAARQDGAIVAGAIEADSQRQASETLIGRGLLAIAVTPAEATLRRTASRRDLAIVFRSIAALVSAGVPLERALVASEALVSGSLRETLKVARERLREGASLA